MTSLQTLTGGSCNNTGNNDNNTSNNLLLLQASPVIPDNNGGGQAMNPVANNLHHDNSSHSDGLSSTPHIHGHEQPNNMSHMNGYNQVNYFKTH